MPVQMTKKQEKEYLKKLRKKIYDAEFAKQKTKEMKKLRVAKIQKIQDEAKRDAKIAAQSGSDKLKHYGRRTVRGMQRVHRGAVKIQKKREELGKKVSPYLDNLNKQFDLSEMMGQKKRRKPPYF